MNINALSTPYINNFMVRSKTPIRFCAAKSLSSDVFEKNRKNEQNSIRQTTIKKLDGKEVEVFIEKQDACGYQLPVSDKKKPVKFIMAVDKNTYYASGYGTDADENFTLHHLFCDEIFNKKFKGCGSELLKSVIIESKIRGLGGRIETTASNYPPPFVFYYKNNFYAVNNNSIFNAGIDYAARNNIPVTRVIGKEISCIGMELDEKGADAFLSDKREYLTRNFETLERREIKGSMCESNLIEAPRGVEEDFYIQIINPDKENRMQVYAACLVQKTDSNNDRYLEVFNIQDLYANSEVQEFAQDSIRRAAEKLGIEKVVINDENVLR